MKRSSVAVVLAGISLAAPPELTAPRLLGPSANARIHQPVRLEWARVAGAAAYTVQVSDTESFAAPLLVDKGVSEPRFPAEVLIAGSLWWRVRAVDPRGVNGPWSAVRRLEILPPPLAQSVFSIGLTPSSVAAGVPSEGLVTLDKPAPEGGASVALTSSDHSIASVPARVILAAGTASTTFLIRTSPETSEATVRVSAASAETTRTATLTITPPTPPARLSSLTLNPATLAGGNPAQATVTLAGPAPSPQGTTVKIAVADGRLISAPATVKVPAGARAENFLIKTARATSTRSVTVTATLEDVTRTATLTVKNGSTIEPLAAPELISPSEDARVGRYQPTIFAWSEVSGAASYTIEIDGSASFEAPLIASQTVPATRLTITPLPRGPLWWRVRANDPDGAPGEWSPPRRVE